MIKHILRRLLPPGKVKTHTHETKFGSILANLAPDEKAMMLSFYTQWAMGDKKYLLTLIKAPKKVQKAWKQLSESTDRQDINTDFKKYVEESTDDAIKALISFQKEITKQT